MLALLGALLLSPSGGEALTRSLYIPVEIRVCEHLEDAILYRGDEPLRSLPGKQVFQFTFFPELGRIAPELERVRVEGARVRTEIIITPASVYVGNKKIDLDLDGELERLRHHVDVRHETVKLTLRCGDACARSSSSAASR